MKLMKLFSVLYKDVKSAVTLIAIGIVLILLHIKLGWLALLLGIGWLVFTIKKYKR